MRSVLAILALTAAASAAVIDLTPDNFDSVVDGSKGAFVEFYAPWCGHCKQLAPEYEIVGETYKAGDNVVIAKVDADEHKSLSSRFGVRGFPTLKWFPEGSTTPEDYSGGRTAEDIVGFVNSKTGLQRRVKKAPTAVQALTASSFDSLVLDPKKAALVEFFAPWCGHCKQLAPKYEKLAQAFAGEEDVVIASVDATKEEALASKYDVAGYPTIKFFPRGEDKTPQNYEGGREVADFVNFLNKNAGTERTASGGLTERAGRVETLDEIATLFAAGSDKAELLSRARKAVAELSGKQKEHGELYVKAMEKVLEKGQEYVTNEVRRLEGMLASESVAPARKTNFAIRKNILSAFLA